MAVEEARTPSRSLLPALAVPLLVAGACGGSEPDPAAQRRDGPGDVLLVSIDTLRADHLGCYGYERPTSPFLDRLAERGVLFEVAYAPMGTTSPAHATLFTSRSPIAHGLVRNGIAFSSRETTLAEIMAANGYRTAAFVSSYPVGRELGFDQGFSHYDDDFDASEPSSHFGRDGDWAGLEIERNFDRRAADTVDAALARLGRAERDEPLFVWVHLFDPHGPYDAPEPWKDRFVEPGMGPDESEIARYDAEVRYVDEQLARLVAAFEARAVPPPPSWSSLPITGRASGRTAIVPTTALSMTKSFASR